MTTTSRFMSALALADILVLSMTATGAWLEIVLDIRIGNYSLALCHASHYFYYVPKVISAWILVIATVERAIRLWMPHRVRLACRPSIAVAMIALVCGLLSVAYLPFFTELELLTVANLTDCIFQESGFMITNIDTLQVFDLCMFFVCPFSIILVCNLSILIKIIKSRKAVQASGGQTTGNEGGRRMLRTVTWRIIGLCLTFCVCIGPYQIHNMFLWTGTSTSTSVLWSFIRSDIFHIIMFLNNGVNFILYCMIGSGFRKDLMAICKCRN
ncbi:hypothetical protein DPMN_151426 [Dreissena polymorpha]|uniref:G-protein coupled receptors family 1 profile domain-containing protein n=1 Tax=Dreissena polymorpha TaxID=45954 RepID=A0A9D4J6Y1_DREPO|nr:hypothetical protein DPMN_151426 [Dreissena polymorpha]